jgi:hypothetical protein
MFRMSYDRFIELAFYTLGSLVFLIIVVDRVL